MSTGIIVLARMDSRRLPGKVLRRLGDRPILFHVIDRVLKVEVADKLVVATSDRAVDDPIADAVSERACVYRGPADDVALRCFECAEAHGFSRFCRISADSPFIDPGLVSRLIRMHREHDLDIATNLAPRSYPYGVSAEVLSSTAMRRVLAETEDAEDREHVTRYIYSHQERFRLMNVCSPNDNHRGVRLVVDDANDLRRAQWIVSRLAGPPAEATIDELVDLAREWDHNRDHRRMANAG